MPGPPVWKSEVITLPDAPNEPQKFLYCNLIACVHYLFQQPNLAKHMDYVPMWVFNDNGDCVYHELCSGHEWKKQQVSKMPSVYLANASDWPSPNFEAKLRAGIQL